MRYWGLTGGFIDTEKCIHNFKTGVSIHWTGLLDWITGLDYWTRKFLDTAHKQGYADN